MPFKLLSFYPWFFRCQESGISTAQLHGDGARASLFDLPSNLDCIYVMHAQSDGSIKTALPQQLAQQQGRDLARSVDWLLVDGLQVRYLSLPAPVQASLILSSSLKDTLASRAFGRH